MSAEPRSPPVHIVPLVHFGATENGSPPVTAHRPRPAAPPPAPPRAVVPPAPPRPAIPLPPLAPPLLPPRPAVPMSPLAPPAPVPGPAGIVAAPDTGRDDAAAGSASARARVRRRSSCSIHLSRPRNPRPRKSRPGGRPSPRARPMVWLASRLSTGCPAKSGSLPYGSRIRPGAPFAPAGVWQPLQSPDVCSAVIARSPPAVTTFA